jgi:periplasmic protein TonB
MKPDHLLQADLLDIVFENRNKEYGAYELRLHYQRRLLKSLWGVFVILPTLFIINGWLSHSKANIYRMGRLGPVEEPLRLIDYHISPKEPPVPPSPIPRKLSTAISNGTPVIVRDPIQIKTPLAVDQLDQNLLKPVGRPGAGSGDAVDQAVSGEHGQGPGEPTTPVTAIQPPLEIAETMPQFPGGIEALKRFLTKNLRMPREDVDPGTMVRVLVKFVVNEEGNLDGLEIIQSGGTDFDNEVARVIKKMPHWKPGLQNGHRVAVFFKLPVVFQAAD